MALTTVSSDRLSTNVKNTNFTAAEKQDLTDDILPLAGQLGNRNLIINGAMNVAQRGTSSTSSGYATVDRFKCTHNGTDEAPTQAQVDVSSSDLPFTKGITKALKITNGNQTSGAGVNDYIFIDTRLEATNVRNSGWNYLSSSSFLTLSFYVKSSVAQNFYGYVQSFDGTGRTYPFETGSLSANTWTKITKTIPGNSGLGFDNDNNMGFLVLIAPFWGTTYTDSGVTLNQWGTTNNNARTPDNTSTWYTTNDATFEITGVQLEVGSVATDFEHRSFAQELALCQRYYFLFCEGTNKELNVAWYFNSSHVSFLLRYPTTMRAAPTLTVASGTNYYILYRNGSNDQFDNFASEFISTEQMSCFKNSGVSGTAGQAGILRTNNSAAKVEMSAEL